MLNELRKSYPPKLSSHSGGLNEEKESEDKIDETYQSANELLIETKVGFHLFFEKMNFDILQKSFEFIPIKLNPFKTITPDTSSLEQQQRNLAEGELNFSVPEVETEKARPASPKDGSKSVELFGSEPSAVSTPTEDQKKDEEPLSSGLFDAKSTSEVLTTSKPAVNFFGLSSSNVPKSDVLRRSSRKTAKQIENERKELWESYLEQGRIDG